MDRRLKPIRRMGFAVLAGALLIAGPWVGWWTLIPLLIAGGFFFFADAMLDRVRRPEYLILAAWIGSQLMIASSVLLTGGPESPAMAWFAIPVVTLSTRFSMRGVVLGVGITLALMLACAYASDAAAVLESPQILVMPIALVMAVGIFSTALMRSDVQHRSEAVIDPLTGMLNRKALDNRLDELRQQSEVTGASISAVMIDVDHFKRVNDTVGHATGDAVLRDVAYIIRKDLRAFELAYRLGGEEFLVLLPGAERDQALLLADGLRDAVSSARFAEGMNITISCGVAASRVGEKIDFEDLMASADRALYEAKRDGRNLSRAAWPGELAVA